MGVTVMYIELVSKSTKWEGDRGVLMSIRASFYPQDYNGMSEQDVLNTKNARTGLDIEISGLGEVSAKVVDLFGTLSDTGKEEVHQWLDDKGLVSEWREETAKYIKALSRVELPVAPDTHGTNYLAYRLRMPDGSMTITVAANVYEDRSQLYIYLRDGDDKYDCDRVKLGECTITGPVTTLTLKAEISRLLDRLWDLLQQPMVAD